MNETVNAYFKEMQRNKFVNAGIIEDAAILLESADMPSPACGAFEYWELYLQIADNIVVDAKYQCLTPPFINVIIDILCIMTKGNDLQKALLIQEDTIMQYLGCEDDFLRKITGSLLEMLRDSIQQYHAKAS